MAVFGTRCFSCFGQTEFLPVLLYSLALVHVGCPANHKDSGETSRSKSALFGGAWNEEDPHVHLSGVLEPEQLLYVAQEHGSVSAGIRALGIDPAHVDAFEDAKSRLDLRQGNFEQTYEHVRRFRQAAFERHDDWIYASIARIMKSGVSRVIVQIAPAQIDAYRWALGAIPGSASRLRAIVGIFRNQQSSRTERALALLHDPDVHGVDIIGAEERNDSEPFFTSLLDRLLDIAANKELILRIHAGEGFLGRRGIGNVNMYLRSIAQRAADERIRRLRVIIAHAVYIDDIAETTQLLNSLRCKTNVVVNVNPLSNVVFRAVSIDNMKSIAALQLPRDLLHVGTDNIGTLAENMTVARLLAAGQAARAAAQARRFVGQVQ